MDFYCGALRVSFDAPAAGYRSWRVQCGRRNDRGPVRKQTQKQWDKQRSGDSRQISRQWNQQLREGVSLPGLNQGTHTFLSEDRAIGKVISAQANFMTVIVEQVGLDHQKSALKENGGNGHAGKQNRKAGTKLLCVVRALLKKIKRRVMVGDKVVICGVDWTDGRGMIEEVLDRKSETVDPPVANVDLLLVLFSLDRPRLDPVMLNRFLVEAESTGIPVALLLNKADLVSQQTRDRWEERLMGWGYKPYICSVESNIGLSEMGLLLERKTSVLLGPSGVGKSSFINALRRTSNSEADEVEDEEIRISEVSLRTGSGRHTTRHVSLVQLPFEGAMLADTPGFSFPTLSMVSSDSLALVFPEVRARLEKSDTACAFVNCKHMSEPGCVVGSDWERYAYYIALYNEIKKREEHEKSVFGTKQECDMRFKIGGSGVRQAEPMLLLKKHRRMSRRQVRQTIESDVADEQSDIDELEDAPL